MMKLLCNWLVFWGLNQVHAGSKITNTAAEREGCHARWQDTQSLELAKLDSSTLPRPITLPSSPASKENVASAGRHESVFPEEKWRKTTILGGFPKFSEVFTSHVKV